VTLNKSNHSSFLDYSKTHATKEIIKKLMQHESGSPSVALQEMISKNPSSISESKKIGKYIKN